MTRKEYNSQIKKFKKEIQKDFIDFLENKNLTDYYKNNLYCGTFEDHLSLDPWHYVTALNDDLSVLSLQDKIDLDSEWKHSILESKYGISF